MKVFVVVGSSGGNAGVFKTRKAAHIHLRRTGQHPLGGGFWGEERRDILDALDFWVEDWEVRT